MDISIDICSHIHYETHWKILDSSSHYLWEPLMGPIYCSLGLDYLPNMHTWQLTSALHLHPAEGEGLGCETLQVFVFRFNFSFPYPLAKVQQVSE